MDKTVDADSNENLNAVAGLSVGIGCTIKELYRETVKTIHPCRFLLLNIQVESQSVVTLNYTKYLSRVFRATSRDRYRLNALFQALSNEIYIVRCMNAP